MAIAELDEQLLVRAHQAGDEHAFGQIVRSQHRALYAHAYRRLNNHEAAEDAVQDTLLRAYRALPSFDGDLRLRAWLHRILTNVCHDESSRRRRDSGLIDRLEAEPIDLAPDPVDEAILHDTVRVMTDAIAELPESYREALVLRYVDGLSFREVGDTVGITEENARARVHRGRLALHKVLSRVSVMLAFLVPGLRRTQKAIDGGGDSVASSGSAEHTLSLSQQLATHVYNATPALNRVAAEGSSFIAAKTSAVATVAAAVAAVAAPVAAYRVYDAESTPDKARPAAVAAPLPETHQSSVTSSTTVVGADVEAVNTTSTTVAPTTSTLPPSAQNPFAAGPVVDVPQETTTTTTPPPTTTAPPVSDPGTTVAGSIAGTAFAVTGTRPDFDVSGPITVQQGDSSLTGQLSGRLYVADAVGGDAIGELTLVLDDGREFRLRLKGTLDGDEAGDGSRTLTMHGAYSLPGGDALGLAPTGTASVVFHDVDAAPSSLSFDLQGQQHS